MRTLRYVLSLTMVIICAVTVAPITEAKDRSPNSPQTTQTKNKWDFPGAHTVLSLMLRNNNEDFEADPVNNVAGWHISFQKVKTGSTGTDYKATMTRGKDSVVYLIQDSRTKNDCCIVDTLQVQIPADQPYFQK
jgi:hypothetical protein